MAFLNQIFLFMDTRLYFLKEPIVAIGLLFIGVLGVTLKQQGTVTQYKIESDTETETDKSKTDKTETQQKTDTTEWRKLYYEYLYSNSK